MYKQSFLHFQFDTRTVCVSFKCDLKPPKQTTTFQLSAWVTGSDYSPLSWTRREMTDLDTALLVTTRCWNVFPFFLVTMVSVLLAWVMSVLSWGELSRVWSHCESCTFFFWWPQTLFFTQVERLVQSQLYRTRANSASFPLFSCVNIFLLFWTLPMTFFFCFIPPPLQ